MRCSLALIWDQPTDKHPIVAFELPEQALVDQLEKAMLANYKILNNLSLWQKIKQIFTSQPAVRPIITSVVQSFKDQSVRAHFSIPLGQRRNLDPTLTEAFRHDKSRSS